MQKKAKTDHEVIAEVKGRWSPRAFDADKDVGEEVLRQLFEAARWAASSYNEQPWRYIVASKQRDPDVYEKLLGCLNEFNRDWAKNAPVLAISFGKVVFSEGMPAAGNPNEHYQHDVGAASAQLSLQATDLGLYVHQMAGFDQEKTKQEFSVPQEFQPVAAMAIGYQAEDANVLSEELAEQEVVERSRQPQADFVWRSWGESR